MLKTVLCGGIPEDFAAGRPNKHERFFRIISFRKRELRPAWTGMHCSPVTEFVQGMACIPQESGDFINCSPFFGALDCGGLAPRFSSRSTAHIFLKNRGNRRNREANTARDRKSTRLNSSHLGISY